MGSLWCSDWVIVGECYLKQRVLSGVNNCGLYQTVLTFVNGSLIRFQSDVQSSKHI